MAEPAETTEHRLEALVAAMGAKGDLPAAARVIQRLHEVVRKENCNALDVARIILADPGLSSKVLRVVNSSFYRPRGEPVSTITRAVILLGFAAIRDLTTGVVLLDQIARASGGRVAIQDLLQRCLLCGSVARALSTAVGYPNPEEAYLLGLFANWGELCLAAYYPDQYERAVALARDPKTSRERALGEVFGVASADLATTMLARWSFPPSYAEYFGATHPDGDHPVTTNGQRLFALVDLANHYAAVADAADPEAAVDAEMIRRYETMFSRRADSLLAAVHSGFEAAREHAPLLRVAATPHGGRGASEPKTPLAMSLADEPAAAPGHASMPAFEILAEISRAILAQENINDTLAMVLEGVVRTGRFDVAFLALLNGRRDRLDGRLGYGDGVDEYLRLLSVPLASGAGVLAESVLAQEPRMVTQGSPAMLVPPGAPAPAIPAASFIAYPLVVRGKAVGVMVAARGTAGAAVGASDLTIVQLFCNQAGLVLDRAVG